ncbi:MAG TPA: glycosyltransferase family 4 protein [Chthoniobacterales bacterium]|jgi:glycosyltransferase involved in cell wall biosynthesis|nr:glycosyltransferase family 4 protein [Chthoniobacterales bacterium]
MAGDRLAGNRVAERISAGEIAVPARPKILIIGDAVAPSGFARVIRSIFEPLQDHYELHQLATRFDGGPHDYTWKLYPAAAGKSRYGFDQIASLIDQIEPAIVFLLYDIVFQVQFLEHLRKANRHPKFVFYSPVESGPIAPEIMQRLGGISRYVVFTEYGRREIEIALRPVRENDPAVEFPALEVIPHGVATNKFFPLPDKAEARRRMRLGDAEHRDAFIVLNANRNMPRKRIDLTIQGFALFAKDKPPDVKLYLHMATEDTGWNVLILAKRYGIFDRLIMTQADNTRPTFSDEQLNLLYNACDVGINTTTGEGWGMPSFEHAATRAAQIVPRHTSLVDLWKGAAEFLDPVMTLTYPGNLTDAHIVTPEGVARALQRLYDDRQRRDALAEAGYRNSTRPEFNWNMIAGRWRQLFNEMLAE